MKKRIHHIIIILSVLFMMVNTSTGLQAYERMDLVDPADFTIRISNMTEFIKAVEKSNFGQLWNSNQMKPFINNQSLAEVLKETLLDSLSVSKKKNKQISHLTWKQMAMIKGEFILGISMSEAVEGYVLSSTDEAAFLASIKIDERIAEIDEDHSMPQIKVFNGVDIYRIDNKDIMGKPTTSYSGFYGGTLISSSSLKQVEKCIVRLKNELPEEPKTAPVLDIRLNGTLISKLMKQWFAPNPSKAIPAETDKHTESSNPNQNKPAAPDLAKVTTILNAVGLDQLRGISMQILLKPRSTNFKFAIDSNGPIKPKGIWAVFSKEHLPRNHQLAYVPRDAYSYQVMRLDLNGLWKEIPTILEAIDPKLVANFQAYTGMMATGYQLNLSKDLFENLGTLYTTISRMDNLKQQELNVWQLRNPEAIDKILTKLLGESSPLKAQFKDYLKVFDLQGQKLYCFKTPAKKNLMVPPDENPSALDPDYMGISVVGNSLAFGSDKMIRNLIHADSGGKKAKHTFYQAGDYLKLMKQVPEDAVGFKITDSAQAIKYLLKLLKKPTFMMAMASAQQVKKKKTSAWKEFLQNLQFQRLPPVEFISSFFGKMVSYVHFEGNSLVSRGSFKYLRN